MRDKIYPILPWASLLGAVLAIAGLILNGGMRAQMLNETDETSRAVDAALAAFENLTPANADDPVLRQNVENLRTRQYVASVWLSDTQGKILYSAGSTAFKGTLQERVTNETKRILASLPAGALSDEQSLLLAAASAIQAEGEHNDVYRHRVLPLRDAAGRMVAVLGVAYDVSAGVGRPDAVWIASLIVVLGGFCIYWVSLPAWTYLDAARRGEAAWLWAMFVLLGNVVALTAYLIVRAGPRKQPW